MKTNSNQESIFGEPILNSDGFYVYPPKPMTVNLENTENAVFTYNGVVLPPLPWTTAYNLNLSEEN